jgi:hypothetical protein
VILIFIIEVKNCIKHTIVEFTCSHLISPGNDDGVKTIGKPFILFSLVHSSELMVIYSKLMVRVLNYDRAVTEFRFEQAPLSFVLISR